MASGALPQGGVKLFVYGCDNTETIYLAQLVMGAVGDVNATVRVGPTADRNDRGILFTNLLKNVLS